MCFFVIIVKMPIKQFFHVFEFVLHLVGIHLLIDEHHKHPYIIMKKQRQGVIPDMVLSNRKRQATGSDFSGPSFRAEIFI